MFLSVYSQIKSYSKGTKLEAGQQHFPTGGPTYQDPSTSEHQPATTGEHVASTKRPGTATALEPRAGDTHSFFIVTDPVVEMINYADPSTVKNQASPANGDLYAKPKKDPKPSTGSAP